MIPRFYTTESESLGPGMKDKFLFVLFKKITFPFRVGWEGGELKGPWVNIRQRERHSKKI
jgi:hypothetical protein